MGASAKRARVLVIGLGSEAHGRERRVVNLFRHAEGAEPFFLTSRWGDGSVESLLQQHGFASTPAPFGYLGRAHPRYTATTLARLPELTATVLREYRRRACDGILVANLNGFTNALLPVLLLRATGARVVFYLGDWVPQSRFDRVLAAFVRWCANRIITNSESGRRDLAGVGIDARRVEVVYNGVRLEEFQSATPLDFRTPRAWPRETMTVGFAGRFTPAKGVWEFARAAETLLGHGTRCRFVMIGNPDHNDSCQSEIAAYVRARGFASELAFAGHLCDMPAAYAGLDVMVVPSRRDTLPNVILEAMASGLPVVATAVGGIPEAVVDGETGYLVPPGDPALLARVIAQLADDETGRRRLGERGRQRAQAAFDVRTNARQVERILLGQD